MPIRYMSLMTGRDIAIATITVTEIGGEIVASIGIADIDTGAGTIIIADF